MYREDAVIASGFLEARDHFVEVFFGAIGHLARAVANCAMTRVGVRGYTNRREKYGLVFDLVQDWPARLLAHEPRARKSKQAIGFEL